MAVPTRISDLSATAASNSPAGSDTVGTTWDDYLRAGFSIVRGDLATKGADIASASSTDLGAVQGLFHDITGTTTITSLGTVAAGIWKVIKFEGALTLTHNATSLILPGASNITTADGDVGIFASEGSGNWRCVSYVKSAFRPGTEFASGTLMLFQQTSAPTGWTKQSTHNDKALRVVSGTASSGGATAFTSVFGAGKSAGSYTLALADIPNVTGSIATLLSSTTGTGAFSTGSLAGGGGSDSAGAGNRTINFSLGGGGGSHTHTLSLDLNYVDVIIASKD